jgi:hypothetical protein
VTAMEFRELALGFPEAVESSHVSHPDFRIRGKVFATLGYPDDKHGVLMLTPDAQNDAIGRNPKAFSPASGAWGRRGNTVVLLTAIRAIAIREWMEIAWGKVAPNKVSRLKSRR